MFYVCFRARLIVCTIVRLWFYAWGDSDVILCTQDTAATLEAFCIGAVQRRNCKLLCVDTRSVNKSGAKIFFK